MGGATQAGQTVPRRHHGAENRLVREGTSLGKSNEPEHSLMSLVWYSFRHVRSSKTNIAIWQVIAYSRIAEQTVPLNAMFKSHIYTHYSFTCRSSHLNLLQKLTFASKFITTAKPFFYTTTCQSQLVKKRLNFNMPKKAFWSLTWWYVYCSSNALLFVDLFGRLDESLSWSFRCAHIII